MLVSFRDEEIAEPIVLEVERIDDADFVWCAGLDDVVGREGSVGRRAAGGGVGPFIGGCAVLLAGGVEGGRRPAGRVVVDVECCTMGQFFSNLSGIRKEESRRGERVRTRPHAPEMPHRPGSPRKLETSPVLKICLNRRIIKRSIRLHKPQKYNHRQEKE